MKGPVEDPEAEREAMEEDSIRGVNKMVGC